MYKSTFILGVLLLFQLVVFAQLQQRRFPSHPGRPPVANRPGRWVMIARTEVRLNAERDVVNVTGNQRFQAIKLQVSRNPVEIYNLNVVFQNGQRQSFKVRNNFQPGSTSRNLDFTGQARRIRQIIIDHRSGGHLFNQRAYVDILGLL